MDKYGDYLVVQFLALGMEVRKAMIVQILIDIFHPLGIYERSDVSVREKEGLPLTKGKLYGEFDPQNIEIVENGIRILIDLENGQKTGYFLDQKENRDNLKDYVKNKDVLDCFSNIGGFSLCASKYQAKKITAIDISPLAIQQLQKNAKLNGFTNIETITANVFEQLRLYRQEKRKFDVIILDPPAFTKSKDTIKSGYRGYMDINIAALKCLNKGGYLISCSCSQHLTLTLFLKMIKDSIVEAKVTARMVELRSQGKDHATLIGIDEAMYLKVAIINVL